MENKIGFVAEEVWYPVDEQDSKEYVDSSPSRFIQDCAHDCGITIDNKDGFKENLSKARYKGLKYLHDTKSGSIHDDWFWKEIGKYGDVFYIYIGKILEKIGNDPKFNYDMSGK